MERWTALDIDAPDAGGLTPPGPGVHVLAFMAAPVVRSDGWAPRAAVEIARAWAAEGSRIVLCDTGFEEPSLHEAAGLDNLEGISDALLFGTSFQRVGQPLSEGLFVATAGTAVPDGEALRAHPRWRDFARGFTEAGALLVLYVPSDAPGADALLDLCGGAVVLAEPDEAVGLAVPDELPVWAAVGPEGPETETGPGDPAGTETRDVRPEPTLESAPTLFVDSADEAGTVLDVGLGEAEPEVADSPAEESVETSAEESVFESLDGVELAPEFGGPSGEPAEHGAAGEGSAPPFDVDRSFPVDPLPTEPVTTPSSALEESGPDAGDEGDGTAPPSPPDYPAEPTPSRTSTTGTSTAQADSPSGRTRNILLGLLLVLVATVALARAGIVGIPGLTPGPDGGAGDPPGVVAPGEESTAGGGEAAGPEAPVEGGDAPVSADGTSGGDDPAGGGAAPPLRPFFLALGSFEELDLAQRRARVNRRTFPAVEFVVAPVEVNGRPWFRLLAGPASAPSELAEIRERLTGSPVPSGSSRDWFVREADLAWLLSEFDSLEAAEDRVSALEARGLPAYVLALRESPGRTTFRVYAGAYANAEEARYMEGLLQENGIRNARLTERRGIRP